MSDVVKLDPMVKTRPPSESSEALENNDLVAAQQFLRSIAQTGDTFLRMSPPSTSQKPRLTRPLE